MKKPQIFNLKKSYKKPLLKKENYKLQKKVILDTFWEIMLGEGPFYAGPRPSVVMNFDTGLSASIAPHRN